MRRALQTARAVIGSPWTRVSGTVVGLAILAHSINVPQAVASLAHADPLWIAAALGLTMLAVAASVVEWGVLLRTANAPAGAGPGSLLSWRRLSSTYLQGVFFTQMLPAGVGGDAMRTVEMGRQIGHGRRARLARRAAASPGMLGMTCWGIAAAILLRALLGTGVVIVIAGARRGGRGHLARGAQRRPARAPPPPRPRVRRDEPWRAFVQRRVRRLPQASPRRGPVAPGRSRRLGIQSPGPQRRRPRDRCGPELDGARRLHPDHAAGRARTLQHQRPRASRRASWWRCCRTAGVSVAHAGAISVLIDLQMVPFAVLGAVLWSRHRRSSRTPRRRSPWRLPAIEDAALAELTSGAPRLQRRDPAVQRLPGSPRGADRRLVGEADITG